MGAERNQSNRIVIPRWRNFKSTVLSRELNDYKLNIPEKPDIDRSLLEKKIQLFLLDENLVNAVEVVNTAFIFKEQNGDTKKAAQYILNRKKGVTKSLRSIAEEIINPKPGNRGKGIERLSFDSLTEGLWKIINELKGKVILNPFNSILWIELSRYYLILGQTDKAKRSVEIALHLAPNNRYVVRSAVRLFIHCEDFSRAHHIIKNTNSLHADPWLLGTEISVSLLMNRFSRNIKKGLELIERKTCSPFSTSELSSTLATLEFHSGNLKRARKLFDHSLVDPNDNSLAQASWMYPELKNFQIQEYNAVVPNLFEANAYMDVIGNKFEDAYKSSLKWFLDQPFSRHPAIFGSYIAGTGLNRNDCAIELIDFGLKANPRNFLLLNNKAYYSVCIGNLSIASETFKKINRRDLNDREMAIYNATNGLIQIAQGSIENGLLQYDKAISIANSLRDKKLENRIKMYKARAQILYNKTAVEVDGMSREIESIKVNFDFSSDPVFANLITSLEDLLKQNESGD